MSSHYETASGFVWRIRDGMIPSDIVSLCEEAMRCKMYDFIQHEVDFTTFAKPALFLGDLQWCKRVMEEVASGMDLMEHLMRTRMYLCMCGGESMQIDVKMVSNCENIDELLISQMAPLFPHEQNHIPNASCDIQSVNIQEHLNISIRRGECPFNIRTEVLGQIQNHNAPFLYLPFTDEMCTQLNRRLIQTTKSFFSTLHREHIEARRRDSWIYLRNGIMAMDWNRAANWKAQHACLRDKFLKRVGLHPPQVLRVIDIKATCKQGERVVLIDYLADGIVQQVGYTAISHTYGMAVYEAFDCPCASECFAKVRPRCSNKACPHVPHQDDASSLVGAASEQHKRIVNDTLRMCHILRKTGVNYAWHDGVCIAQHDNAEVEETIKHMGWIYANAKETVIFLHYIGNPMAPIRNSNDIDELCCRWHTRVWTLQEAALSKSRRYCVRVGTHNSPLGDCQSLEEFEEKIDLWYGNDSSAIEIMEEERFFEFLKEIHTVLCFLCVNLPKKVLSIADDADDDVIVESNWMWAKALKWYECTSELLATLLWTCFEFPTMERALYLCCCRDSKHRGDKMNSILALAEVKGFSAAKDENVEAATIEFFERQGQVGLTMAVFSINRAIGMKDKEYITEERQHTWPPILWSSLTVIEGIADVVDDIGIGFKVLEDGRMELRGELRCVKVRFTVHQNKKCVKTGEAYTDNELVLPNDLSCLDMDLTQFHVPHRFKASISECITGDVYISAIERCNSQGPPLLSREIKDGDSFHAYLVFPKGMSLLSSLIVQGRLDSHVSKVGLFKPTRTFLRMVPPALAQIETLLII